MIDESRPAGLWGRAGARVRQVNQSRRVVGALRGARRMLPGSGEVAFAGSGKPADRVARLVLQAAGDRPSAVRELGLATVQAWRALTSKGAVDGAVTIMFTDLVGFSSWALRVGDDQVLRLLRQFFEVTDDVVGGFGGVVVKSLGDGAMVAFSDVDKAVEAAAALGSAVNALHHDGYRPSLRVGLHRGRPRKVGRDYVGVDVNIAARVADAAGGGEVLVTGQVLDAAERDRYVVRSRRFRAKGVPKGTAVFAVVPHHGR
ncbi:adenylate/guanylate cyclase domain-containing protein [Saccharopolyspora rhizosphaerae]|uniref:Adenylate/guanylate cyclase domain-containing protein n=1 Tax=Saccharopolyspora rhizosphaerae TaxID=2492662 RepID=A0A3R8P7V1_9PSEU|nr:adenylate/guanylate cyclase domain-containing protein [Saccharopolyspora rhizosphaerae]RRO18279.1 adenylate/guanylate cyclase domain-containing protein [Saccharopolyspora rhizosphaerae]